MGLLVAVTPCLVLSILAVYGLWLRSAPRLAAPEGLQAPDWPAVDVIVATFNERQLLEGKLENLARLEYPRERVRFIIVDGASTDGSHDVASAWSLTDDRFVALATETQDKAAQLNLALRHARTPWVVVTDADARMPVETLQALMTAARDCPALGLIGSPVVPVTGLPVEQMYWRMLNWLRLNEWRRGSASMVMAPCYAFRRVLIDEFADDAIADDVHVAWKIGSAGHPIGLAGPIVEELRGPMTVRSLFQQKVRRAGGILREAFRFAPRVTGMVLQLRAGFGVRFALLLLGPALVASAAAIVAAAASWLVSVDGPPAAVAAAAVLAICGPAMSSRVRKPVGLVVLLVSAASTSLLIYPFFRPAAAPGGAPERVLGKVR